MLKSGYLATWSSLNYVDDHDDNDDDDGYDDDDHTGKPFFLRPDMTFAVDWPLKNNSLSFLLLMILIFSCHLMLQWGSKKRIVYFLIIFFKTFVGNINAKNHFHFQARYLSDLAT